MVRALTARNIRPEILAAGLLLLLVALAVWIRGQYASIHGGNEPYLDWAMSNYFGGITGEYLALADNLLQGKGYSRHVPNLGIEVSRLGRPPGYSLFLAAAKLLGTVDLQTLRVAQSIVDSSGVVAVFVLLRWCAVGRWLAALGALLYAMYPLWAAGSTFLLAESLSTVLFLWTLVALVWAAQERTRLRWLIAGALLGISALIRPDFVLLIGVASLWAVGTTFRGLWGRALALLWLGFLIPTGAWGLHNKLVHDQWVFTSTGGGYGLWEGLGELPNPYGYVLSDAYAQKWMFNKDLCRVLGKRIIDCHTPGADRYLKQEYLKAWSAHPDYVLKVIASRWEQIVFDSEARWTDGAWVHVQDALNHYGFYVLLLAALIWRRRPQMLFILAMPLFYALFSIGLVHYEPRYVRYVHLSYAFSSLLVLWACWERFRPTSLTVRRVVAGAALSSVLVSATAGVHVLSRARDMAQLPQLAEEGKLATIAQLADLVWTQAVPNIFAQNTDGSLSVQTDQSSGHYQLTSDLDVQSSGYIYVTYSIDLHAGGVAISLLDKTKQIFVANKSHTVAGTYESAVAAPVSDSGPYQLILSNFCPQVCQSEFDVHRISIYQGP